MAISNKQKALIHIAKQRVGMSDAEYGDLLAGFGVASSRELNRAKFDQVMRHFKKLGFHRSSKLKAQSSKDKLLGKIEAIRAEMKLTRGYVDAIARNMFGIDVFVWCSAEQLHKIVAALTYHQRRAGKRVMEKRRIGDGEKG